MALTFTPLPWLLWSGKHQEPKISNGSSLNSSPDSVLWESDTLKFPLDRRRDMASSSRRVKRKWQSREERKIDREYDIVIVPSDGGCVSGSESDDSDWSVGWLEPHGPGFHSDDDLDDSFAVLVPCYGYGCANVEENAQDKFLQAIGNLKDIYATVSMEHKYRKQPLYLSQGRGKVCVHCTLPRPQLWDHNGYAVVAYCI